MSHPTTFMERLNEDLQNLQNHPSTPPIPPADSFFASPLVIACLVVFAVLLSAAIVMICQFYRAVFCRRSRQPKRSDYGFESGGDAQVTISVFPSN